MNITVPQNRGRPSGFWGFLITSRTRLNEKKIYRIVISEIRAGRGRTLYWGTNNVTI